MLRLVNGTLEYAASHRRLPHVGSKVAFLPDDVLQEVSGHNNSGAEIGYFALGEFVYAGADKRLKNEAWMQVKMPAVISKFDVSHLVSRRTFVFARAGFGKSNLVKLLFTNLYKTTPTVEKRAGRRVPVGTIIFDPDGEYFWPDDKNRPGLCDVPELEDKVVVFTKKKGPSAFYDSFVAGDIKLDIRRLRPGDVISIALPVEKQDQQNVAKLKGMNDADWRALVDEIYSNGNAADLATISHLLHLDPSKQEFEAVAARSNMTRIVRMLHNPSSQMMDMLIASLKEGKICVVDVSQMRGTPALVLSGLLLQRVFDHNQEEFTKATPETIPTLAVVEEAQSVLGSTGSSGEGPYISWVKEGRKYDLGAVLITQQPGSISHEILSQGDNWFIFHLLSAGDLFAVKKANGHFSDDLLSTLLNEPIVGHGIFWSSAGRKSYPIPLRVLSFEQAYSARDPKYGMPAAKTFAQELKRRFLAAITASRADAPGTPKPILKPTTRTSASLFGDEDESEPAREVPAGTTIDPPEDFLATYQKAAIKRVASDQQFIDRIRASEIPWRGIIVALEGVLPDVLDDRNKIANELVPQFLTETFGEKGKGWDSEKRARKSGSGTTTWVVIK